MKYYESSKFPKAVGSVGFYSIIAVCIVAIGAISWFAVSSYNKSKQQESPTPSISEPQSNNSSNIIEDTAPKETPVIPAESVETTTEEESVPYDSEVVINYILPVNGKIIKDYSDTALQYSKTYGDMRMHSGIDISAAMLSDVKAAADGNVIEITDDALLGKCITIEHTGGVTIKYCGLDTVSVAEGESIPSGRVIGSLGSVPSECADDTHLHIEVKKDGKKISPLEIFKAE